MATSTLRKFYRDDEDEKLDFARMSDEEEKQKSADLADFIVMRDYRKNSGWEDQAVRGMKIYNVAQVVKPDDEVSRIMIGYTRTQIDRGIEQMSAGEPDFDFDDERNTDNKQQPIWKALISKAMYDCNYKVQQDLFFRDYFTMGCGVFEVYTDYPQRTVRIPQTNGKFFEKIIRDRRRPRVGIRALNPMACWRSSTITDTVNVPSCVKRRVLSWDQFVQEYARCFNADGSPRYKNIDKVSKTPYVIIYTYQNELTDGYREYALGIGNETGLPHSIADNDFGVMIDDKSLKIHNIVVNGIIERSIGVNLQGTCTMRWGTFFDVYDDSNVSYGGSHSVYGVGLPRRIEGEDMILQTMFNQHLDNERWASSFVLNYKGNSADSYIDMDANRLYGGELIDGEINPMPLGISRGNSFEAMKSTLDSFVIPATGINHQQMVGDTSKTAFEFAQRIKQANASAEQRLLRLETELFGPIGQMLFSAAITELTVEEWEDITEESYELAKESIKEGKYTAQDYRTTKRNGIQTYEKRMNEYVKVPKLGLIEDFKTIKKRVINPNLVNASSLIFDPERKGEDTFIPIVKEYVYPLDMIENDILPRVTVSSKRMIKDMKAQNAQEFYAVYDRLIGLVQMGWQGLDLDKTAKEIMDSGDIEEKRMTKDNAADSEDAKRKEVLAQMESIISPSSNDQSNPQMEAQSPTGTINPNGGAQPTAPSNLEKLAQGLL